MDRCLPAALSNAFQSDIFRSMLTAVVKQEVSTQLKEEIVKVKEEISEVKEEISKVKHEISSEIKKELDERENTGRK